jgi:predicted site-specific integrase-resolvase
MLISLADWAERNNVQQITARQLIRRGRLPEAHKIGRNYVIEESTPYPADARVKTGKYKDWRKKPES